LGFVDADEMAGLASATATGWAKRWTVEGCGLGTVADSFAFLDFQNPPEGLDGSPFKACSAARSTKQPGFDLSCVAGGEAILAARGFAKFVTTVMPACAFCFFCRPLDFRRNGFCTEYLFSIFREFARAVGLGGSLGGFSGEVETGGCGHCVILTLFAVLSWLAGSFSSSSSSSHHSASESLASEFSSNVSATSAGEMALGIRSPIAGIR
jgi:hypothetical protein